MPSRKYENRIISCKRKRLHETFIHTGKTYIYIYIRRIPDGGTIASLGIMWN